MWVLLAALVTLQSANHRTVPYGPPGWVGLYSQHLLDWMENESNLDRLCGDLDPGSAARERCREDKIAPRIVSIGLYAGPARSAARRGSLLIVAHPGKYLGTFYEPPAGGELAPFTPDLFMEDLGYEIQFHETYLDRRGDWFLLPEGPFPAGTWINARDLGDDPHVLAPDGIVESPRGNVVILAVDPNGIRVRPEQPADMWCEAGDPPPRQPVREFRIDNGELYTRTGHLRIRPAYPKGC